MRLKATILTKDADKISVSVLLGSQQVTMYWPLPMIPQALDIGDNFHINISEKLDVREEFSDSDTKSLDELRALLYELIN